MAETKKYKANNVKKAPLRRVKMHYGCWKNTKKTHLHSGLSSD